MLSKVSKWSQHAKVSGMYSLALKITANEVVKMKLEEWGMQVLHEFLSMHQGDQALYTEVMAEIQ